MLYRLLLKDSKELIYFTGALVALCGLIRPFSYTFSEVMLPLSFLPYLIIRSTFYLRVSRTFWSIDDKQRLALLGALLFTLVTNFFTYFKAEFLLLFFLMLDYLTVVNKKGPKV